MSIVKMQWEASLRKAAARLEDLGRVHSSHELFRYALRKAPISISLLEDTLAFSQRHYFVNTAQEAFRELCHLWGAMPDDPIAIRKLAKAISTPIACLSILEDPQSQMRTQVVGVPGTLLYVLNYSLPQTSNGYTTRAHGLTQGMREAGIRVHCLTRPGFPIDVGAPFVPSNNVDGIEYRHIQEPVLQRGVQLPDYMHGAADRIESEIRKLRPQVVMAASNHNTALPALIAARRCGLPFWYEVRGFWEMSRLSKEPAIERTFNYCFQRELDSMTARAADRVFTLTGTMREELVKRGVERERIDLLPNSVDTMHFLPRPSDKLLAAELGIPANVPVVGYVGSFVHYEGLQDLVRACAALRKRGFDFRLMIVGNDAETGRGPIAEELAQIASKTNLNDWLILPGRVPHTEVARYYSLIDIAPFPRRAEKVTEIVSPLKPLEALAMGKAVVVPSLAVMSELIQHDHNGLIYERGNVAALEETLGKLIRDSALRRRLGKSGRQWVETERSWQKTASSVREALAIPDEKAPYREVIRKRGFEDATQLLYADIDLNLVDGSSIWLSSMASILAANAKTIVLSKAPIRRNQVIRNIVNTDNVLILTPENITGRDARMPMPECVEFIRKLDRELKNLQKIVIRGSAGARELMSDRQFYGRAYPYLTDLYQHTKSGIEIKPGMDHIVDVLARQSAALLVQTPHMEAMMREMTHFPFKAIPMPPPVPDNLAAQTRIERKQGPIRIGYAGKIAPQWGIQQLTSWTRALREEGFDIELTIIGDKIGGAATPEENEIFRAEILEAINQSGAEHLGALERKDVFKKLQGMDFAWCWRPGEFEDHTLELSTKLIEGVISGLPSIAYPGEINRATLGEDYGFFIRNLDDFRQLLTLGPAPVPDTLRERLQDRHGITEIAKQMMCEMAPLPVRDPTKVCLAAHDPKFIYPYFSYLKSTGISGVYDVWKHAVPVNETETRRHMMSSDIILCEWGLGNAVWYSHNLPNGPRLVVRMHSQEVRTATNYGKSMAIDRVDKFVFVTEWVRDKAIEEFGIPPEKTCVIPNFIMEKEFLPTPRDFNGKIRLGMVGIVPQLKRFDRAVTLLKKLIERGHDAELWVKGKRPEEYPWMLKADRAAEMDYYRKIYAEIEADPSIRDSVHFEGWGNDVARFYDRVDHIFSASDLESFHYALADGVLSGCHPIVWSWSDAEKIYSPDWVIGSIDLAVDRILNFRAKHADDKQKELAANRAMLVSRYGSTNISRRLDEVLFG